MTPSIWDYIDAVFSSGVSASAQRVAVMLRRMQGSNKAAFPKVETLQDRVGLGRSATLAAVRELQGAGLLVVVDRRHLREPNAYTCDVRDAGPRTDASEVRVDGPRNDISARGFDVQHDGPRNAPGDVRLDGPRSVDLDVRDAGPRGDGSRSVPAHGDVQNGGSHLLKPILEVATRSETPPPRPDGEVEFRDAIGLRWRVDFQTVRGLPAGPPDDTEVRKLALWISDASRTVPLDRLEILDAICRGYWSLPWPRDHANRPSVGNLVRQIDALAKVAFAPKPKPIDDDDWNARALNPRARTA